MSYTSRDWNNSCHVQTHEKNSRETVCWLGTIIQRIFCAQSGADICLNFGNSSVRVGTQRLFRPYLKTFVPPFLPTWLTAPGSPRMLAVKLSSKSLGIALQVFWLCARCQYSVRTDFWIQNSILFPNFFPNNYCISFSRLKVIKSVITGKMQGESFSHDVLQTYRQDWIRFDQNETLISLIKHFL